MLRAETESTFQREKSRMAMGGAGEEERGEEVVVGHVEVEVEAEVEADLGISE
jgi:hypothetical protein